MNCWLPTSFGPKSEMSYGKSGAVARFRVMRPATSWRIFVVPVCFLFQAEDGIRDVAVTGVQTCALPISVADADQIIVVQRGERLMDGVILKGGNDLVHGNRPAPIQEHPQNPSGRERLPSSTPRPTSALHVQRDQLIGGLDLKACHRPVPLPPRLGAR